MNVAIVGSRSFFDYALLRKKVLELTAGIKIDNIISGGAGGADRLAEQFAEEHNIPTIIHLADWDNLGKRAGMLRNEQIIADADIVIAFWDQESRGTKNSIDRATEAGKQLYVVPVDKIDVSAILTFGKHKGALISDVANSDPDYLKWVLNNFENLKVETQIAIEEALKKEGK